MCCCSYLHASVLNKKYSFLHYICSINNITQYTIDFVKGSKYIYNTFLNDAKYCLNIVIGKIPKNIEILFLSISHTPTCHPLLYINYAFNKFLNLVRFTGTQRNIELSFISITVKANPVFPDDIS